MEQETPLLTCKNLEKWFFTNSSAFQAVNNVSFTVHAGESVGIVGESGSGKSTIAKMITLFERPDKGDISLAGTGSILSCKGRKRKEVYRCVQMVFQNPTDSFDPHLIIGKALEEVAINYGTPKDQVKNNVSKIMEMVGLKPHLALRYRQQLSGGECQRAAIARALLANPKLLICDEITSALDVSVQAQILELVQRLHQENNLSLLVISHDLAVVNLLCSRVLVIKNGSIVEQGSTQEVLSAPKHPYTQVLVAAAAKASGAAGKTAGNSATTTVATAQNNFPENDQKVGREG